MQMTILRKSIVTPGTIHGHSQQFRSELSKLGEDLVIKSHLVAAYRAPVRRIKRQNDGASQQVAQSQGLIGRHVQREIWGHRPCGEDPHTLYLNYVACTALHHLFRAPSKRYVHQFLPQCSAPAKPVQYVAAPDRMPLCVRLTALSPCSELSLDAHEQIDRYRCTASSVLADLHRQKQSEI